MSTGREIGVVPSGRRMLKVSVVAFGSTAESNVARYCCMSILFKEVMERENFGTEGTGGQGPQQQQLMLMMICLPQWEVIDVGESFIGDVLSVPGIKWGACNRYTTSTNTALRQTRMWGLEPHPLPKRNVARAMSS